MSRFFSKDGCFLFITVTALFVLSRLLMPAKFDGSYIDEYWHIASGVSIFDTGKYAVFYNDGQVYDRGLLMSLWVGLWVTLFGHSIYIAKLAPVSISIINFFCYLYLCRKIIPERALQIVALMLFVVSPWLLFNHSYIRFYVINEMLLLLTLVVGYMLYEAIRDTSWRKASGMLAIIAALNLINILTTNDPSKYMLLIASAVMLVTLFVFDFNPSWSRPAGGPTILPVNRLITTVPGRIVLVAVIVFLGTFVVDIAEKFDFLLHGKLPYTSPDSRKYEWLFWQQNAALSVFFILALLTFWFRNIGYQRVVVLVAGVLFAIHYVSSKDLQIIRGILYFIPVYYLVVVIGLSRVYQVISIKPLIKNLSIFFIGGVFLFFTVTNVEKDFYYGPRIKREISYIEYRDLYTAVKTQCEDKLVVEAAPSSPFVANFYGVNVDFALSAAEFTGDDDLYYLDDSGVYRTVFDDIQVIDNMADLASLNQSICLVVREPSKTRFITEADEAKLKANSTNLSFYKINLYIVDKLKLRDIL